MASLVVVLKIDHEEVEGRQRRKQETQLEGSAINTSMVVRIKLVGGINDILKEETRFTKCTRCDYKEKLSAELQNI